MIAKKKTESQWNTGYFLSLKFVSYKRIFLHLVTTHWVLIACIQQIYAKQTKYLFCMFPVVIEVWKRTKIIIFYYIADNIFCRVWFWWEVTLQTFIFNGKQDTEETPAGGCVCLSEDYFFNFCKSFCLRYPNCDYWLIQREIASFWLDFFKGLFSWQKQGEWWRNTEKFKQSAWRRTS